MVDAASPSPFDDLESFVTLSHTLEVVGKYPVVADCQRSVSYAIFYTRGLGIHRRIEVFRKQGTLMFPPCSATMY